MRTWGGPLLTWVVDVLARRITYLRTSTYTRQSRRSGIMHGKFRIKTPTFVLPDQGIVMQETVRIVAFHGTSHDFSEFDDKSIGQGAQSEPNNRLGVYLTPCPTEAFDFALSASARDESIAKVVAVVFEGRLGPAFFSPIDQFVEGDLHDSMEGHPIADAFREAHAKAASEGDEDGDEVDRCKVFADLRTSMSQSFDALWIENGSTPHLVILNPTCLRITHKFNNQELQRLENAVYDAPMNPFGEENCVEQCIPFLDEASKSTDACRESEKPRAQ